MRRTLQIGILAAVIPLTLALASGTAEAQRGRRVVVRPHTTRVVVSGYVGFPYRWGYWDPYWFGPYWGYPYYFGYWGGGYYYDNSAEIRVQVKPKEAQVYVDGYYAGVVDDFDGVFQRLHVSAGEHELVVYLKGYHPLTQNLHLGQRQDTKIKANLQPLAAGEADAPLPQPIARPADAPRYGEPGMERRRPGVTARPVEPRRPERAQPPDEPMEEAGQAFGSLVVRVQPSGADILIDGERWQGPEGAERLVIQLSEGTHRVEVRKDGYAPFSTTVRVRRGETAPLNVSLPPRGE